MARKGQTTRRYQENLEAIPENHKSIVADLDEQFGRVRHNLWDGDTFHCSPLRMDFAKKIRAKHLDDLTDEELDALMFRVMSTMGDVPTLKFLLPRFFAAYFSNPEFVATAEPFVVKGKLEEAKIEEWPVAEKQAALAALIAYDRHDRAESLVPDEVVDGGNVPVAEWAISLLE